MLQRQVESHRPALAWVAALGLALAACSPSGTGGGAKKVDFQVLNPIIDQGFGGRGTCVSIRDIKTGGEVYAYGSNSVCMRQLPPCSTFKIANALIGLDAGLVTPGAVVPWDGKPAAVKAWETDADLAKAFKLSMVPWFQRLARQVGHEAYVKQLKALDYGSADPAGPVDQFWLGPQAGGGLTISTRQQSAFIAKLYSSNLPVKATSTEVVEQIMVDERRGDATMSGKTGTCSSLADGSRSVGWWVGRVQTKDQNLAFAVSMEGASALPGRELQTRFKSALTKIGLWPAA
jgi:beta-lactamase class D